MGAEAAHGADALERRTVFRTRRDAQIFYCESAIIALVCYVLALIGCFVLCAVLNGIIMQSVSITLLVFGPLSWLVMLVIAVFTSALATFLPVRNYTKRKPIESIRAI